MMTMQDQARRARHDTLPLPRPRADLRGPGPRLLGLLALWIERATQRRALAELDDRLLKDVGISRSEARQEAAKPFWR